MILVIFQWLQCFKLVYAFKETTEITNFTQKNIMSVWSLSLSKMGFLFVKQKFVEFQVETANKYLNICNKPLPPSSHLNYRVKAS